MQSSAKNLLDRLRRDIARCESRLWWINVGLAMLTIAALLFGVFVGDMVKRWGW